MSFGKEMVLARGPERVVGYHGCHQSVAEQIAAGGNFIPSANEYDWLGGGIYFWEYAPARARQWARRRFKAQGAVVQATITLGRCLNLLDTAHFKGMKQSYQITVSGLQAEGLPIPENTTYYHNLDCLVVDSYCLDYTMLTGIDIQTVRGCFPEGKALFKDSYLLDQTHVQIAVRDSKC